MRLGRTAFVNFVGLVVVSLSGFVATFAIATLEGSAVLGRYAIAVALGAFLLIIPAQAVGQAVTKRMSEGEEPAAYLGVGVLVNGSLVVGLVACVVALGVVLRSLDTSSALIIDMLVTYDVEIAVLVAATTAFRTVRAAIEGDKRVGRSGLLQGGERVARTLVQIGAIVAGFGVAGLIIGHGITLVAAGLVGLLIVRTGFARPAVSHVRNVLRYAKYAWLGTLRTRVFGWLDTFVLSFFVTASLVGIYEVAWGIASLLGIVSPAIRRTLFPEVSELSVSKDYDRIKSVLGDGLLFSGIVTIPGLIGAAVIGERVLRFYRPEFEQGVTILLILIGAYVAEAYGSQFVGVVNAVDRPSIAYRVNLLFIVASVVLTTALTWAFGWHGAAVATASAAAFRAVLGYHALVGEIGEIPLPFAQVGLQVIAASVMALVVYPAKTVVPPGRSGTLLLVCGGAAVYFGTLYLVSKPVREKAHGLLPTATA